MRLFCVVLMSTLIVACSASSPRTAVVERPVASIDHPSDPEEIKALFIAHLKRVADGGDLFDPRSVAPLLDMHVQSSTLPQKINADCSKSYGFTAVDETIVTADAASWYRPLPSGKGRMNVPAFTINPATTTPDAAMSYKINRYVHCRDTGSGLVDSKEATLSFGGLPSFACVTAADVQRLLPAAQFIQATDGVSLVQYQGRVDVDAGSKMEFWFRAGVPCALGATIKQQQLWGLRYLNANYAYEVCRSQTDRDFCSAHPEVTWPNDIALKELISYSGGICGTPNSIYLEKKEVASAPPQAPRWRNWSRPG